MAKRIGTEGDDLILGDGSNDTIEGLGGNDTLIGDDGADKLYGGDGADILGGSIRDVDYRSDDLYGGAGSDTFAFYHPGASLDHGGQRDQIHDFEAGDKIDLSSSYFSSITWDDITVEALPNGDYRVHVDFAIDSLDMAVDVTGVMPTEDSFIFLT